METSPNNTSEKLMPMRMYPQDDIRFRITGLSNPGGSAGVADMSVREL
jgi:hypothetical protein